MFSYVYMYAYYKKLSIYTHIIENIISEIIFYCYHSHHHKKKITKLYCQLFCIKLCCKQLPFCGRVSPQTSHLMTSERELQQRMQFNAWEEKICYFRDKWEKNCAPSILWNEIHIQLHKIQLVSVYENPKNIFKDFCENIYVS